MTQSHHKDTVVDTHADTDTDSGTPLSRRVASSTGLRWHLAPWAMRSIVFTGWHWQN
jgi:hypothetical protein